MSEPHGGIHLPSPSVWPFVLGAGVALAAFGVPTNLLFSLVGAVLVAMALVGWIGDLRRE
ncbi:MAG TPA: cytochrome c oxidase subunit 4 [Chloroflexota bacterium]|nr:cytochrome c oxidase subunit 4 [Chloroflexota bacterium]